jgi:nitroimidazol reductase NimA-like FMN-containing flavoprotein (pyridoxamine 5'-phosphate oxidase superfamily)
MPMPRTAMTRLPEKSSRDLSRLHQLLDQVQLLHVGLVTDEGPLVVPTAGVRVNGEVVIHGSTGSGWMRRLATGAPACVTVTAVDALVVARSGFESSYQYRSAVMFGAFRVLTGQDKEQALDAVVERLIPGRTTEVRSSTTKELAATMVLSLPLDQWSLRISEDWPEDPAEDVAGSAWAGIVPVITSYGAPVAAPDLRDGIVVPASVRRLVADQQLNPTPR